MSDLKSLASVALSRRFYLIEINPSLEGMGSQANAPTASSTLAYLLGLTPESDRSTYGTYKVVGFEKDKIWCESSVLVALPIDSVKKIEDTTVCGKEQLCYVDMPHHKPLPYVDLNYGDSLVEDFETPDGELTLRDKPTLDGGIKDKWWDGVMWHGVVWLRGSYKGYHVKGECEATYNPFDQEICIYPPNQVNKWLRISEIEVCWQIINNVVRATALVTWRPNPKILAHVTIYIAFKKSINEGLPKGSVNMLEHSIGCCKEQPKETQPPTE